MKNYRAFNTLVFFILVAGLTILFAQSKKLVPTIILPDEVKWNTSPNSSNGIQTIVLTGDPDKDEFYTTRVKIPANLKLQPHWHPEGRVVTVISGTLYYSYGDVFDESKLMAMPPGTFFTEPSMQHHFAWAKKSDVVVQVVGFGPTGTTLLKLPEQKKN